MGQVQAWTQRHTAGVGGTAVASRFALLLNWTDGEVGPTAEVQLSYVAAAQTIFELVRDRLGG